MPYLFIYANLGAAGARELNQEPEYDDYPSTGSRPTDFEFLLGIATSMLAL